jgi:hypothetical protein
MITELEFSDCQWDIIEAYAADEIDELGVDPDEYKRLIKFVNETYPGHIIVSADLDLEIGVWRIEHEKANKENREAG